MAWTQLRVLIAAAEAELCSELLQNLGAVSITFEDTRDEPILEPALDSMPLWSQTTLLALFPIETAMTPIVQQLAILLGRIPTYHLDSLSDQDWQRTCLADWQPLRFGQRLWICPSWQSVTEPNAIVVQLDPGLAFGTGTHPTTALCLDWLAQQDLNGCTLVDYGCGSGILSIAALRLGAKQVYAVDHDPQALLATRNNAKANQLTDDHLYCLLPEELPFLVTDIVLANILAEPLLQLADRLIQAVRPAGYLVLSGILAEQANQVMTAYQDYVDWLPPTLQDNWVRLVGQRKI